MKRVWPLFASERELRRNSRIVQEFCQVVIQAKRRTLDSEDAELGPDLISRFLERSGDEKMPDQEIVDIVLNFMLAGRDTTACWLTWTFYEISTRPDVIANLRAEIKEKLGAPPTADDDSLEFMSRLPYLHAVVTEVLRLHPSVPVEMKFAAQDDILPDGTTVPEGSALIFSPYAMGRDERLWEDCLEFKPSRWLSETGSFVDASQYKFPVFNAGPRICLGKPLAYLEVKLFIVKLLDAFEFEQPEPTHDGSYLNTLVFPVAGGLPMKVTPRERS